MINEKRKEMKIFYIWKWYTTSLKLNQPSLNTLGRKCIRKGEEKEEEGASVAN